MNKFRLTIHVLSLVPSFNSPCCTSPCTNAVSSYSIRPLPSHEIANKGIIKNNIDLIICSFFMVLHFISSLIETIVENLLLFLSSILFVQFNTSHNERACCFSIIISHFLSYIILETTVTVRLTT